MLKDSSLNHLFPIRFPIQTDLAKMLVLIPILLKYKSKYPNLDTEFMKDAFLLYNLPKDILKHGTVKIEKYQQLDLVLYKIFKKYFENLGLAIFDYMHKAYLLQLASKEEDEELSMFPTEAIEIITYLRITKPDEVRLFSEIQEKIKL